MTEEFGNTSRNFPSVRMRRMRAQEFTRRLMRETRLSTDDLIYPVFIFDDERGREPVPSMPGIDRVNIKELLKDARQAYELGIPAIVLFPVIPSELKTEFAEESHNPEGLVQKAIRALKKEIPDLGVITDVALDPYTIHGQDGIIDDKRYVINDKTVEILTLQALSHARAGADIVAPSDMMDGRVGAIRKALDQHDFANARILAYSAKYASSFYGPFRDAIGSAGNLAGGDKYSYQMDPANSDEALRETALDINEGADMIMVKPALPCLDVLYRVKQAFGLPTFVYNVSGEYAMLKAASRNGWLDDKKVIMETLLCCKRAGADAILTYHAVEVAGWLKGE